MEGMIELDHHELNDLDDGEQNLEDEAQEMLSSWNRAELMKEALEDQERMKREKENKDVDYYDGETSFAELAKDMDLVYEDDKVRIKILERNPTGKQIDATHTILFDRIGYLEEECVPFDNSLNDGRPVKLSLIEGPLIPGMLQALLCLREGERANILIHPSMAYGKLGVIGTITEDAYLFYHVKIYKVWEESQLNEIIQYERDHYMEVPIEHKLALVAEHKQIANTYLHDDMPKEALVRYKAAIKCLDELAPEILEKCQGAKESMTILLQNCAIAYNKMSMYKSASNAAKRALSIEPRNLKAYYQLVKARIGLSDYSGALKWIESAMRISPNNASFDRLRLDVDFQHNEERKKRDDIMRKMSQGLTSGRR